MRLCDFTGADLAFQPAYRMSFRSGEKLVDLELSFCGVKMLLEELISRAGDECARASLNACLDAGRRAGAHELSL